MEKIYVLFKCFPKITRLKKLSVFTVCVILLTCSGTIGLLAQTVSGGWDGATTVGTAGYTNHGSGVIQLLTTGTNTCAGAAVHETSTPYNPSSGAKFSKCFQVFFSCPGNDNIGSDSKGDGLAFSFWKSTSTYNLNNGLACGGGLGYMGAVGDPWDPNSKMMTIEFDTYSSQCYAGNFDCSFGGGNAGSNDEISIHKNGNAQDGGLLAGSSVNAGELEDGKEHTICIGYDPATKLMTVSIDGVSKLSYNMGADDLVSYFGNVNLNYTLSAGKYGATSPITVSDGAKISDIAGAAIGLPVVKLTDKSICAGAAAVTFDAGAGFTSYQWTGNGSGTAQTTTGSTAGNYIVNVTNAQGCSTKDTAVLTVNPLPTPTVANKSICTGDPAATFDAGAGYSAYAWSGNGSGTAQTTSGTAAGNYTVQVTDANGCKGSATGVLTVNTLPATPVIGNKSICAGDPAATFDAGAGYSTYAWSGNGTGTSRTTSGTTAGNYTVTVTNAAGCKATATATLTVNPLPTPTVANKTICAGDPAATFDAGAGYSAYLWSGNGSGTSQTTSGTTAGSYTVQVTDAKGCKASATGTLTVNPLPTPTVANKSICAGDAAANFDAGAGYTAYLWSGNGSGTSQTTSGSTAGNYTVQVTDAKGCKASATGTLTVNPLPTPTVANKTICAGDPAATFDAGAGYSAYSWSGNGSGTSQTTSGTTAGNYTVQVTDAKGCKASATGTLTVNPVLSPTVSTGTITNSSVQFNWTTVAGATGYTLSYKVNGGAVQNGGSTAGTTFTVSSLNPGDAVELTVMPTGTGCFAAGVKIGTANNCNPITVAVPASNTYCPGDNVPASNFTSTPAGATYTWTNSDPSIGLAASGTGDVPAFAATNTGTTVKTATITVTPSIAPCTGTPNTYTITVNPAATNVLSSAANTDAQTLCVNNAITPITYTIGGSATGATLTGNLPAGVTGAYDPSTKVFTISGTPTASSATPFSYTVTTTGPCPAVAKSGTITVNPILEPVISCGTSTNTSVEFTWAAVAGATGYSITYSKNGGLATNGGTTTNTTFTLNSLAPGDVIELTVLPTGAGCFISSSKQCEAIVCPTITVTVPNDTTVCNGGTVAASKFTSNPAGATYSWTNSNPSIGLAASGTGDVPSFTATNTSGSPVTATITVTPSIDPCSGIAKSYKVTVNPSATLVLTSAAGSDAQTVCINQAITDIKYLVGGSATGATLTGTLPAGVSSSYDPANRVLTITGTPTASSATAFSYTVTTTGPCTPVTLTGTITVNPEVQPVIKCGTTSNSTVDFSWNQLTGATGYSLSYTRGGGSPIDGGTINTTNFTLTALNPGEVVELTVMPAGGGCFKTSTQACMATPCIPITVAVPNDTTVCNGDQIPATNFKSSPAGATFTWTNDNPSIGIPASGTGNIASFKAVNNGNSPVTATITVTPSISPCPGTPSSYKITINPTITPAFTAVQPFCEGGTAPALSGSSNNTPAVTGTWNPPTASNTQSAIYTFTPDAGQCAVPVTLNVTVIPNVTPTFNALPPFCEGATAPALLTSSTNTPAITGTWNPPVVSNTQSATYTFTPDAGQCALTTTLDATVIPNVTPKFPQVPAFCSGQPAPAFPSQTNTPAISGSWTPSVISNQSSGTYTFKPNAGQCALDTTINVTVNQTPVAVAGPGSTICIGNSAEIGLDNTVPGYTYKWTTDKDGITKDDVYKTTVKPTIPGAATYTLTVTAAGNCTDQDNVIITVVDTFKVDAGPDVTICSGVTVNLEATSTATVSYTWSNEAKGAHNTVAPAGTKTYYVTATNGACSSMDSVTVKVKNTNPPTLFIPNSFSPNDDNVNDEFRAFGDGVIEFEGNIFDRWGQLVYHWDDIEKGWNGKVSSGEASLNDVFVYVIRVKNECEDKFGPAQRGTVTVFK